jgi:hypothetical protein
MRVKKKVKSDNQYLAEDGDLLKELDAVYTSSGQAQSRQELEVSKIQIKATLRHRKTTSDSSKTTNRVSLVILTFASAQLFVAIIQLTFSAMPPTNKWIAFGLVMLCLAFICYLFYLTFAEFKKKDWY